MTKLNEKGVVQFIIPIVLLLGIAAGVWLITAGPLNLLPKAFFGLSTPISAPVPPSSEPPVVTNFTVSPELDLTAQMNVTCTPIPNQKIIAAIFSFGDATPDFTFNYSGTIGASTSLGTGHIYAHAGTYTVGVRCKDDNNSVSLPTTVNITLTAPTATPAPSSIPASLSYRRVFVTSNNYNGNLGGLSGADNKCLLSAYNAGLSGPSWKAWLSDGNTSAASRLEHASVPYKLLNSTTIANNWDDLTDGSIQNPIITSEILTTIAPSNGSYAVWTNTTSRGIARPTGNNCDNWTSAASSSKGFIGLTGVTNVDWTEGNSFVFNPLHCDSPVYLYCIEQTPTVEPTPTPIPTPTPTPANVGIGGPSTGGGGGGGSTTVKITRTIKYYRVAETITGLTGANWTTYNPGAPVDFEFKQDLDRWPKFIFVQFGDAQQSVIPINGQSYLTSPAIGKAVESTPSPISTDAPVVNNPNTPVTVTPCDLQGNIANWRNCTKDSLKATLLTLPVETRDLLPGEALAIFRNDELLSLFSKKRLSQLDSKYLVGFSNGDLLALADASGYDRKTFFSGFDCSRIGLFAQDIRDLFKNECGF